MGKQDLNVQAFRSQSNSLRQRVRHEVKPIPEKEARIQKLIEFVKTMGQPKSQRSPNKQKESKILSGSHLTVDKLQADLEALK